MDSLIAIVGPTASGKSNLAIKLAKKFNGEIICADSRTIYKGMVIGTASPVKSKIPHHLLHFVEPDQTFTVAQFQDLTYQIIDEILKHNKIPFLVGGTGLYVDAVTKGLSIPRIPPNPELRAKLEKMSNEKLLSKLKKLDAQKAKSIDPNNKRRLVRALEVCLLTKKPVSQQQTIKKPPFKVLTLGVDVPKEALQEKINSRVDKMIKMGFLQEVKKLLKKGAKLNLPSMSGLGYKQIAEHLLYEKPKTLEDTIKQIKIKTRQFAKRQMTWFTKDKGIVWVKNQKEAEDQIKKFLF
ncbi:MAG: tRNA (adenosine(37)-N6)-dimethylallyltransferase MiaA [Candidatus Berkelbacteria bacterium]|nr:tRNA (adenosine(37)-N6)-dimethylallyltransferase MiaA [Candidatus Berkelbacteria bacterium]